MSVAKFKAAMLKATFICLSETDLKRLWKARVPPAILYKLQKLTNPPRSKTDFIAELTAMLTPEQYATFGELILDKAQAQTYIQMRAGDWVAACEELAFQSSVEMHDKGHYNIAIRHCQEGLLVPGPAETLIPGLPAAPGRMMMFHVGNHCSDLLAAIQEKEGKPLTPTT